MKPLTSSIRRHLLSWLLIPILLLCLIGACIIYGIAVSFTTEAYDEALLDCAHSVANRLSFAKDAKPTVDMPPAAMAILKHGDKDNLYYQILSSKGKIINGDTFIPAIPSDIDEDISGEPVFYDGKIAGLSVRVCIIEVPIPAKRDHLIIKVAETITGRTELIQNILLAVIVPQLILIFLAACAVWFGVSRGLMPLNLLKSAVESRSPSDLSPISETNINVPKEVRPLVVAINDLLARLNADREAQRRFVSNAAHQLRTPLAGLKTQAELALREISQEQIKESLSNINTCALRASRLAQQLLTLARVEPAVFKDVNKETVNFNTIAKDACKELVPQALAKNIDLGFEDANETISIYGDRSSLYEMCINLIENAVLYTQRGGQITVKLSKQKEKIANKTVIFSVEDNGPGIPLIERAQVFERFYRVLGNKVSGSGLGLAIVREIAESHNAIVRLHDGSGNKGTRIEIEFTLNNNYSSQNSVSNMAAQNSIQQEVIQN